MGERIQDNWSKYGQPKDSDEKALLKLENLKKMFLSQKFITLFLRSLKIFENWTLNSLEKLLYVVDLKTFNKNEHIFNQEWEASGFYIIFKGEVVITHTLKSSYKERLNLNSDLLLKSIISDEGISNLTSRNLSPQPNSRATSFESYRQNYHTIINNSQRTHRVSKDIEIKVVGSGHLIGVEDSILSSSIHQTKYYKYTAVCRSATCKVLFFDKLKWFDKLKFLGCYDKIVELAKKKEFRFNEAKQRISSMFKDTFTE